MAEYAGLEIRIGGNTTKLTNALKASTKSAAELQSRIRQITKAMQFDPTNLKNVDTRIKITGDRMQSLQSRVQITKTAMEQLGETMVSFGGTDRKIKDIASETQNVSLAAKQADERYAGLTKTLGKIYEAWNKASRAEGVDLMRSLDIDKDLAERWMDVSTSATTLKYELKELQDLRKKRAADIEYTGSTKAVTDDDIKRLEALKNLNFHGMFEQGTDLDEMVKKAKELGVVIEDSAVANAKDLQRVFKSIQSEKGVFDQVLQFEQMGTDVQRFTSEIEGMSQTMRKLDDGINDVKMSQPFQALEENVRGVDAAISNVDRDLKNTKEALNVDPGNVQLAARYFNDLQEKARLGEERVSYLKQELGLLNADGVEEAAKGHQDLAKWVEESAEAARKAKKDYSDQQATVSNLNDEIKTLDKYIATIKGDSTLAEYSDNVFKWKRGVKELNTEMKELAKAEENVANEQKMLGEKQAGLDNATKNVEKYEAQLKSAREEYGKLQAVQEKLLSGDSFDIDFDFDRMIALEGEIKELESAYDGATYDVKQFNKELADQKSRLEAAQGGLKRQQEVVENVKKTVDNLEKTREVKLFQNPTEEIQKAEGELVEMKGKLQENIDKERELGEAYKSAKTENELAKTAQAARETSQDIDDANAALKKLGDEMDPKGSSILNASTVKTLGMTLSATLTPVLTGIGYSMVDASSTVDAAYRDMRKTVDGTEEQFEHLRKAAIDFSRTHVTSADQILQIEAIGGELGIATENLETFAEVISNIDVASNLDVEGAASALGHLANILHLSEDDYVGFSDALVRLGNNGASTESEIANIAERIGSMGAIVGMSASDVLAWASSIASTGQNAEAAGTAISKTMSFFETAVASAGGTIDASFDAINAAVEEGGDKLTVYANLMGQTADEFSSAWESDPQSVFNDVSESITGARDSLQGIADVAHMTSAEFISAWESDPTKVMQAFIEGLNDIEKAGGSADAVLQGFKITSVRQKQAIEGLMQTIGGLNDNLKMSEDAWNGISDEWGQAGDAANEAAKKAEGFSGQVQKLKNMWQIFLAELGEGAVPIIKQVTGGIEGLSKWFSELDQSTKTFIVGIGGAAAALGPLLSLGSTFGNAWGQAKDWYENATSGMNLVKIAFKQTGKAITEEMASSMGAIDKLKLVGADLGMSLVKGLAVAAVVGGIALIVGKLKELYDRYQDHIAATQGLHDALRHVGEISEVSAGSVELTGSAIRDLAADSRDYESRLADLARTLEDSNRQYGGFAGQLNYYSGVINDLSGRTDLSKEEMYKLESALLAVNDACNTTYGLDDYGRIIDTTTGKVQESTDALNANIEARKNQALIDYYADDYAKATEEWAAAQDKYNEAEETYNKLTKDGAREEYLAHAKEVYGATYDEAQVLAAYDKQITDAETSMKNYSAEMGGATETLNKLEGKMALARQEMDKANKVVEEAAKSQEEFDKRTDTVTADVTGNMKNLSDTITGMGGSNETFNNIVDGLSSISVSASELNGVDMGQLATAFTSVGTSMNDVITALVEGGVHMDTWNAALEQAPGAAENMSSVTTAAFQSMYEIAGSNINDTMTLIAGLDAMEVGDKTFYIGDNGSIVDSQGKIYNIQNDLASIPDEVITQYYVNDQGAAQKAIEAKNALKDVGKQSPTPTINVKDNATQPTETLRGKLGDLNTFVANPSANLTDYVTPKVDSLFEKLTDLNNESATVTIYEKTVKSTVNAGGSATGGISNTPFIPRHASGYIATGPTLTNNGWVGEDGIEYVANWATGGAVVPLTNKKYMLPIADAIAAGMVSRGIGVDGGTTINVKLDYKAGDDANKMARELANAIARVQRTRR